MKPTLAVATAETPLRSLSAIALDTETTSLDVRHARIVEIGACVIDKGRLASGPVFTSLVRPDVAIPPESSAIHGITTAAVAVADRFPQVYGRFRAFAGRHILLGYALGFDFAVLQHEHERAGLVWQRPRSLDVRELAQVLNPDLPDLGLETLAAWLGVAVGQRHRALPDAQLAAEVFFALLPQLRARSIRTVAEAEVACRRLSGQQPGQTPSAGVHIESYPYRHRVRDVMARPAIFSAPKMTVREALALLATRKVSSLFIAPTQPSGVHGIVTERDILRAIDRDGARAFTRPVAGIASFPLASVGQEEFLHVAFGRMRRHGYRHLGVVDEAGKVAGVITQRDLLRLQADEALSLADALDDAASIAELALVWKKLSRAVRVLHREEVDARSIAALISTEVRGLTARAAAMAERDMPSRPEGLVLAIMVLGSVGRGESLLALDQDNAIIFEAQDDVAAQAWLLQLGKRLNALLDEIGVPLCKGGVMAGNAAWCRSVADWRKQVSHWLSRAEPADVLHADIFFDALAVHGDETLVRALRTDAIAAASKTVAFLQLMSLNAAQVDPPIGWFGRFRVDETGRMDLKKHGLMPIFSTARVLALRHNLSQHATAERLEALRGLPGVSGDSLDSLLEAHRILMGHILQQQLLDIERGVPPTSFVDPRVLTVPEKARLKWALEQVPKVNGLLGDPIG